MIEKIQNGIPFSYSTVRTTRSLIDKGLLAIPVSMPNIFSRIGETVVIVLPDGKKEMKHFTPYSSSSKECRIGGLRQFYSEYAIQDGDEILLHPKDNNEFLIYPERLYRERIAGLERRIEDHQDSVDDSIISIQKLTSLNESEIMKREFIRLSEREAIPRNHDVRR